MDGETAGQGPEACAKKFGEEAVEGGDRGGQGRPGPAGVGIGDVLYHLLVMLAARDVPLEAVLAELARRQGQSGLAEKAARRGSPFGDAGPV